MKNKKATLIELLVLVVVCVAVLIAADQPRIGQTELVRANGGKTTNLTNHVTFYLEGISGAGPHLAIDANGGVSRTTIAGSGTNNIAMTNGVAVASDTDTFDFSNSTQIAVSAEDVDGTARYQFTFASTTGSGATVQSNAPSLFNLSAIGNSFTSMAESNILNQGPSYFSAILLGNSGYLEFSQVSLVPPAGTSKGWLWYNAQDALLFATDTDFDYVMRTDFSAFAAGRMVYTDTEDGQMVVSGITVDSSGNVSNVNNLTATNSITVTGTGEGAVTAGTVRSTNNLYAMNNLGANNAVLTNNIGLQVGTVAGAGGANTNFTLQAAADESVIYVDAGTTNVNIDAIMGWSDTLVYRGTVILTNRSGTARTFSLGANTNNWISLQEFDGISAPFTVTNSQAGRFSWEILGTNVQYSYKPMALPTN